MNNTIYPCFWFDGNAREAASFYCSLFKDSEITTDTGLVVNFNLLGKRLMGLNGGPTFTINPSLSLFVLCQSTDETNEVWNKLIEGGKALIPIGVYPWSQRYGWVQDRFGLTWQVAVVYKEGDPRKITPSMLFTKDKFGKAEEALHFYTGIFSNSSVSMLAHYPEGDANAGKVMYAECVLNGFDLIAMDGPGVHDYTFNEGASIVVECETQEEIDYHWDRLTAGGGQESQCGWLKDRFGVSWQVVPAMLGRLMSDPERSPRVMQAFMKMKKFNIEALVNA